MHGAARRIEDTSCLGNHWEIVVPVVVKVPSVKQQVNCLLKLFATHRYAVLRIAT